MIRLPITLTWELGYGISQVSKEFGRVTAFSKVVYKCLFPFTDPTRSGNTPFISPCRIDWPVDFGSVLGQGMGASNNNSDTTI